MREIEFRIKDRGAWYYGLPLSKVKNDTVAFNSFDGNYYDLFADAKTLGQYTGLKDKNGQKIFDGDIIKQTYGEFLNGKQRYIYYCIAYSEDDRCLRAFANGLTGYSLSVCFARYVINEKGLEVIGNIWDNADLLKGE